MLSGKRFLRSLFCAGRGIYLAWKYEQSFRIQVIVGILVIGLILFFQVKTWEAIILLLLVFLVLTLEILNSVLERILDVLKPRLHPYVEEAKDLMAASVLLVAIVSLIVGLLIFWPYFLSSFFK